MYAKAYEQSFETNMDIYIPPVSPEPEKFDKPFIFIQSKPDCFVSESEYWNHYYHDKDTRYEWNNGRLEVKIMPTHISIVCVNFLLECFQQYLKYNPIATLITYDHGFSIKSGNTKQIRRPDYAIILKSNPIQMEPDDHSYAGTYDICIELLSGTKKDYITKDTVTRKKEYARAGVSEYYIIDIDKKKHTTFYRLDQYGRYVKIKPKNGIIQSTILPGFQFRLNDIYRHPDLEELIEDDVYKHYVLLDFQNEKRAKEKERLEKEKALKEIERLKQLLTNKSKEQCEEQ